MSKSSASLLVSTLGSMARVGESQTSVMRRLAAQMNVSDSTVRRAVNNDRMSSYLQNKLTSYLTDLDKYQKRLIYYGQARLDRTTNPRVRERTKETALKDGGKWRREVTEYRNRIQREAKAKLKRLAMTYGEDIWLMGDTPHA